MDTMSNKLFTAEEVTAFQASPYVESASARSVIFTPEFKQIVLCLNVNRPKARSYNCDDAI